MRHSGSRNRLILASPKKRQARDQFEPDSMPRKPGAQPLRGRQPSTWSLEANNLANNRSLSLGFSMNIVH